ncbi:MAG: HD domain-containing protein [Verrucomicrobiae bacterium]|nr:HD domain-containing protein [Verrucomicrobiae bacterium]
MPRIFDWAVSAFEGRYKDYQPVDAKYHDFEHTLQGTLCLALILKGRVLSGLKPTLPQKMFELGMIAILLHDTGYLKVRGDSEGTGAKYTLIHVSRSSDFARQLLEEQGFSESDAGIVQRMIRCTGVNLKVEKIPFQTDTEKIIGYALGSADLIGQMAASDYVDKLPILFDEFEESARYSGGEQTKGGMFSSPEDLLRKTEGFWKFYVLPKINNDFLGQYRFLADPYPDGPNEYIQHIEANVERVKRVVARLDAADAPPVSTAEALAVK